MRKRNIALARAYLAFYILFVFMAAIPPLLVFKFSGAFSIVLIVFAVLLLAGVIASNVFYDIKKDNLFYLTGIISYGLFDVFVVFGLILEIVYAINNEPATYAFIVAILSIVAMGLISLFVGFGMYRLKHPVEEI